MSSTFLSDPRRWEFVPSGKCLDGNCNPLLEMRDELWARHRLQQIKDDPFRMAALRQMLARESTGSVLQRATDNDLINRAAYLFSSGVWHVHSQDGERSDATESTGPWKRVPGTPSAQSRRRQSWRLKTRYRDSQVIRAADLMPGDEYLENPASIRLEILGWAQDPQAQPALAEIHAAISGGQTANPARPQLNWLAQQVESAFRSRTLVLVRQTRRSSSASLEQPAASSATPVRDQSTKAAPEKTWFRMQLLDEDGDLMPGEDYVVTDSAGVRRQGKLDSNSELYIPPILPIGNCTITFPNIHLNPRKRK